MKSPNDEKAGQTLAFGVTVAAGDEEAASLILWELGTSGIESRDSSPGQVQLVACFGPDAPLDLKGLIVSRLHGYLRAPITTLPIPRIDWNAHWRESFQPVTLGTLTIAPPWSTLDVPNERLIVIDPGRAFGTGGHETTQLCLELVEHIARRGHLGSVLDIGTGTGVIAIAAARLGSTFVVGVDNDEDALQSARFHAIRNDVAVSIVHADGSRPFRPASFDVVVANLTLPFLVERGAELRSIARRFLVLSGFLVDDVESLRIVRSDRRTTFRRRGEWAALLQDLT